MKENKLYKLLVKHGMDKKYAEEIAEKLADAMGELEEKRRKLNEKDIEKIVQEVTKRIETTLEEKFKNDEKFRIKVPALVQGVIENLIASGIIVLLAYLWSQVVASFDSANSSPSPVFLERQQEGNRGLSEDAQNKLKEEAPALFYFLSINFLYDIENKTKADLNEFIESGGANKKYWAKWSAKGKNPEIDPMYVTMDASAIMKQTFSATMSQIIKSPDQD